MRAWKLGGDVAGASRAGAVIGNVVGAIGTESFSLCLLDELNALLPVGCWSLYEVGHAHPVLHCSGTYQRGDTTIDSWKEYLSGPHLADKTFTRLPVSGALPILAHVTANELTSPGHRERVYDQFNMIERVSVVQPRPAGGVLALNLYRYRDQPGFRERDFTLINLVAGPVFAAVKRHATLGRQMVQAAGDALSLERLSSVLSEKRPDLSERELAVCARVLAGMSYEGIAADLGLGVPTVKTYRNRAFAKLGIHFKSELVRHYLNAVRQ